MSDDTFLKERASAADLFLTERFPEYFNLLKAMVAINSHTENRTGVDRLGGLYAELFTERGFSVERVPSVNPLYGDHLILKRKGTSRKNILCLSHLDTVFTEEEEKHNSFSWRIEGDRVYGPGTNDIKGGTVLLLMTIDALKHTVPDLFDSITWKIFINSSEETSSDDFASLIQERTGEKTAACCVFEAGRMEGNTFSIVTARKGRAHFSVETHGKGSHAGSSHSTGANAILQMADVVQKIEKLTDYKTGLTVNTGIISGGGELNRVPHNARAEVEMRAFSDTVLEKGIAALLKLNGYSSITSPDGSFSCSTTITLNRKVPAWSENSMSNRIFKLWQSAGEIPGFEVIPEKRGGLSDGNFTCKDIPTIDGLGPAGENAHCSEHAPAENKEQEFALISSFVPKGVLNTMGLALLIRDILKK